MCTYMDEWNNQMGEKHTDNRLGYPAASMNGVDIFFKRAISDSCVDASEAD